MFTRGSFLVSLFITIFTTISPFAIEACSRIFWDNKINKVVARTMDLYLDEKPTFRYSPQNIEREGNAGTNSIQWSSKYGNVVITAFDGKAVSEGMNEKGFSAHLLYLHDTQYEARDSRPGLSNTLWVQYMVDNFSSVKEALSAIQSFQIVSTPLAGREWPVHLSLEDSTGDSAIIEFLNGKMIIHHGPQYTVMTNDPPYEVQIKNLQRYRYFGGKLPLPGDVDPESRFVRCSAFLKTLPEPNTIKEAIGFALGVMRTVEVPFGAENTAENTTEDSWATRWASVSDLSNLVYYFNSTSAPNIIWVNLKSLDFSPNQGIKTLDLEDSLLVGDATSYFK